MKNNIDRRQFMRLAGMGGVVFASGLSGFNPARALGGTTGSDGSAQGSDFFFVQLSDTHWGFSGPAINPDAQGTLRKAIAEVNALSDQPDFVVFTGDLTQTTDDPSERRRRLAEFKEIVKDLRVKTVRYMPGEHDAALDRGAAYKEFFGQTHYTFDYEGVHFIVLDNVSDPAAALGDEQLTWLAQDLSQQDRLQRIVVFTHRPLFDLAPTWDWATRDGARAIDLLMPFPHVTVFYGHIHQEHHHLTGHIAHHAAKGLMFALPAPLSVPKKAPLPWDAAAPYKGLGFREIEQDGHSNPITELPISATRTALL
ncbi:MAG: serine/threonine protein phosphatase [Nevskia sp.]|nr:serine/threonine protein phosphatase [Nevskia sp.]